MRSLNEAYRKAVARKRLRLALGAVVFLVALVVAAVGAEVNLRTFFTYLGNFISYFDRIGKLDNGARVWTDFGEWFWGWQKWLKLLGETLLISYVGTLIGAVIAFLLNFLAAENTSPAPWLRLLVRRLLEFARTVPGIVFALIFVIAFGLGPMAGVLAIAIHSTGALGKLFSEIVENADMKPVEGVRSTGASWMSCMRFAVLPQVIAGYASYALLRFEINVREASVMGFVGAGGIGQELVVAIRKFYYSDVSAILITIIVTVFVIDIATGWLRGCLFGKEARREADAVRQIRRSCARAIRMSVRPPGVGAAGDAGDGAACLRRLHLRSCRSRLLACRFYQGSASARLDHAADAAARSRFLAAALSESAGRDALDRAARHHAGGAIGAAGQPVRRAQHRAHDPALSGAPLPRLDPRRRHPDLGAGLDQRRRSWAVRRCARDRGVGFRRLRQAVLGGDRGRRPEAGRRHPRLRRQRAARNPLSACCRRSCR